MAGNDPRLNFGLDESVEMLRQSVQGFAAAEVAPRAAEIDRDNLFPADLWRKMGDLGLLGITVEEEWGGAGMGYLAHVVAMEELSRASASVGLELRRPFQPLRQPDPPQRHGRAEATVPARADRRPPRRRPGHERTRRRLRRRRHAAPRREARRRLPAERHEDVDHQRPRGRRDRRLRQDRRRRRPARDDRVPGRAGLPGVLHGAEAGQARHARLEHLRAGLCRLRGPRGERAGRGRARRQRADERPRLRAAGAVCRAGRDHAGLPRRGRSPTSTSAGSSASPSAPSS